MGKIINAIKAKIDNGTINIYTMNINRCLADGYACTDQGICATTREEVVQENAEFYRSHSIFGTRFVSIDRDQVLPTEEEAHDYMNGVADKRMFRYIDKVCSSDSTEKDRQDFIDKLKRDSACIYANEKTVKLKETITIGTLKQMIKENKRSK